MTNKKKTLKKATISAVTATLLASTIATSMPFNVLAAEADQGDTPKTGLKSGMLGATSGNLIQNAECNGSNYWTALSWYPDNLPKPSAFGSLNGSNWQCFGDNHQAAQFNHNNSVTIWSDNNSAAAISQAVPTLAGHRYSLTFNVSGKTTAVGVRSGTAASTGTVLTSYGWATKSGQLMTMSFTATSNYSNLIFQTQGTSTYSNMSLVDLDALDLNIVLNPLNSKMTTASGTATANCTVKLYNGSTLIGTGTSNSSGQYSITIPAQAKGSMITAYVYDPNNAANSKSTSQVVTEAPIKATTINDIYTTSTKITGTSEPNATVVVKNSKGDIKTVQADADGNYVVDGISAQTFDDTITATATSGSQTSAANTKVKSNITPKAPIVNEATDEDTAITGEGTPGDDITVTIGDKDYTGKVEDDGTFSIPIPAQAADTVIEVTETDPQSGNTSPATEITIESKVTVPAPTIHVVQTGDTKVTVIGEAGNKITFTDQDGTTMVKTADADGKATFNIDAAKLGDIVTATQTNAKGKTSDEASYTVVDTSTPAAPKVNPATDMDTTISGIGVPGNEITVTIGDKTYTGKVDENGDFNITIPKQDGGTKVEVTETNVNNGNKSPATELTIVDTTLGAPKFSTVTIGNTKVTITGKAGATITLKEADGTTTSKVADTSGKAIFTVDAAKMNDAYSATQTGANGKASAAATYTVKDTSTPAAPTVNPVKDTDTNISGTGQAGDKISIKIGDETYTGTIDENGEFYLLIPKQAGGTDIQATETNPNNNNVSPATDLKVQDTTLAAPTIAKIKAGDTKVTVTGEPGASIMLTGPDGDATTKIADASGKATFNIDAAKAGDKYTATQTGDNGKASKAATATATSNEKPVITANDQSFNVGDTFNALTGVSASDKEDGDLTAKIKVTANNVDTTKAGTYAVTYSVTDSDGNTTTKTITVTVVAPVVKTIKINENVTTAFTGTTQQYTATTTPADETVTWSTSNSNLATVNKTTGLVTFKAPGTVTITAALADGTKATLKVVITNEVVAAPAVTTTIYDTTTKASGTAPANATVTAYVNGLPIGTTTADKDGKFSVDFPAQTADAVIAFVAENDRGITSQPTNVTVKKVTIKINETTAEAFTGTTQTLTATTTPAGQKVEWTSSSSTIATIDKTTGAVSYKTPGTVTFTATLASGTKATLKVVVTDEKVNVAAPTITSDIYSTTTSATGTAPTPGQVIAYVNGLPIGTADVGTDGKFTINFPAQAADQTIAFVAQDTKQNTSDPTNVKVKAATIKINETVTTGFIGDTQQFTATTTPADAVVTWSTSNSNLATVNKTTGLVTYKAAGTVTITATLADGTKATTKIVISAKKVAAPVITTNIYDNTTSASGTVAQAGKVTAYVNGLPIGTTTVNGDGTFTVNFAKQVAGTVISFVAEDAQGVTSIPTTVIVKASTVKINEDITKGLVGNTATVTATTTPADQAVTWSSSDEEIATISATGVITYKAPGSVTITAKLANGATSTKTITVVDLPQPVLAEVDETDTVVNGTIDTTNYDVSQVLILINGVNKNVVNVVDGKFTANIGVQPEGTVIEARYKDQTGAYLIADKYVGKTTVQSAVTSDKIKVNSVNSLQKVVTGKSTVPNASVRLFVDGVQKRTSTTDANGNYTFNSGYLKEGQVVRVELRENNVVTGIAQTTVVKATEIMSLDDVGSFDTYITGKGTPNTQFKLSINGTAKTVVTSDEDGLFSFTVSRLKAGDLIHVDMKSAGAYGEVFKETTVTQGEVNQGDLTLDEGDVGDKQVTGTTKQPNTQVRLSINGATKSVMKSSATGEFTFNTAALKDGDVVKVEMQVNGEYLVSQTFTAGASEGGGGGTPTPAANLTVNPVVAADKKVTGTADAGAQVRISLNGATKSIVTTKDDGTFTYNMSTIKAGDVIKAEVKTNGVWDTSKEVTVQ